MSLWLLLVHYWHRLVGTAGIWFCNNWYFYGAAVTPVPSHSQLPMHDSCIALS